MRRLVWIAATAIITVGVLAPAASAKGPGGESATGSAALTGPGMAAAGRIGGATGGPSGPTAFGALLEQTGIVAFADGGNGGYFTIPADRATRLGPRFELTISFPDVPDTTSPILADVYPYAAGGPVVVAHPGQRFDGARIPSAWYVGTSGLLASLRSMGLPSEAEARAAVAAPRPAADVPAVGGSARIWPWVAGVAALALLVLGAAALERRRVVATV